MRAVLAGLLWAVLATAHGGTVALIIDDLGYSEALSRRALALPPPIAVAVLPDAPHARSIARAAHRAGTDVLVHLPMASGGGPYASGVLHSGMAPATFRSHVQSALARLPWAIGVNNHEGSRLTRQRAAMERLMRQLARQRRPLLFIDSRTTAASRAEAAARSVGIGVARRDVFLDNERDPQAIAAQVKRWLTQARVEGCALAIGHPRPTTLQVLERVLPRADDVERVGLRTYVQRCGTPPLGGNRWHASSSQSRTAPRSSKQSP